MLLGGIIFSVLAAAFCFWSKIGKPVPGPEQAAPGAGEDLTGGPCASRSEGGWLLILQSSRGTE